LEENTQEFSAVPRINIRVESLSDLVFGLALSIGSLELLARTPQTASDLATSIGLFAFSFMIVVAIWLGYARIMAVMPRETGGALSLNMVLLFCVVLEPYLFFVLQSRPGDFSFLDWASFGYAIDVGGMFLILAGLILLILKRIDRKELKLHSVLLERFRLAMYLHAFVGGTYLFSALPLFLDRLSSGSCKVCPLVFRVCIRFFGNIQSQTRTSSTVQKLTTARPLELKGPDLEQEYLSGFEIVRMRWSNGETRCSQTVLARR